MTIMGVVSIFSLFVGIISIILAIFAMIVSKKSEERSKDNFDRTQEMIRQFYDKTKDLLNEIDKRAQTTETIVSNNQDKLMNTITSIINETVIPKKEDIGEKAGMMLLQQMITNPTQIGEMMEALKPIIELSSQYDTK